MRYPRLKELREDHDLSQRDVAKILYIAARTYSHYEQGDHNIPLSIIRDLAKFYNTSVDYILGETDVLERYPASKRSLLDIPEDQ